ncbi:DNA glycosylase [Gloeopeniophorella convolvens]|nr:DNA glycosylase [Gloeopeniophorella convolvens]
MKRKNSALKQVTRKIASIKSTADSSVTLFKLEEPGSSDDAAPGSSLRRSKRVKVEDEETALKEEHSVAATRTTKRRAAAKAEPDASPRKGTAIKQARATPHPAPARWHETYGAIREMRARVPAPVDTMGCDTAKRKETDPRNQRFATLVALMLSSQTKDEVTDASLDRLRAALGGTLSLDALLGAPEQAIADAINKVGFWRRKTQYLRQAAQKLRDEFGSDVPKTAEELCSLPGVGPKMAFLCLHAAWNINVGIGVDVHVHRITNRLGWHKPPTKTPEETRVNLESWLPVEFHKEINHLLVGFGQVWIALSNSLLSLTEGQVICVPIGPKCDQCTLSEQGLCPSAQRVVKSKSKKVVVVKQESGPKIEIAIETATLNLPKDEPASPALSAVSSLTPEPEDA